MYTVYVSILTTINIYKYKATYPFFLVGGGVGFSPLNLLGLQANEWPGRLGLRLLLEIRLGNQQRGPRNEPKTKTKKKWGTWMSRWKLGSMVSKWVITYL